MQVLVTFRHVEPTAALREYAEQKAQRVQKYLRRPSDVHVVLAVSKRRHIAEVTLRASRTALTATEETSDLYAAIDLAMDKIDRQVRRLVAKRKDRKRQGVGDSPPPTRARAVRSAIVRADRVPLKPMSVDEALLQMRASKDEFLLFKNSATDALNVMYRRKDGRYGLIEPEVS